MSYVSELREIVGDRLLLLPSVTACIFDDKGSMLLLRHAYGDLWSTPGGAIEPGETPADAVVRECSEETGLRVRPTEIIGVFGGPQFELVYANGDRAQYVMTVFRCVADSGTITPDGIETIDAQFFGPDEWQELDLSAWAYHVLPTLFQKQRTDDTRASFQPPSHYDS
jgi:8-oxo-dGTP pyrophosphatase MutT (NUDIX family)